MLHENQGIYFSISLILSELNCNFHIKGFRVSTAEGHFGKTYLRIMTTAYEWLNCAGSTRQEARKILEELSTQEVLSS